MDDPYEFVEHLVAPDDLHQPGPAERWRAWWQLQAATAPLGQLAARRGFVLAPHELAAVGVSRDRAATAIRRGRWTRAGHGYLAPFSVDDVTVHLADRRRHALASAAEVRRKTGHLASGRSAAILDGLPTFAVPARPELTAWRPAGLGRRGPSHVHGAQLSADEVTTWFGIPVTTVSRTLVDLARHDRRDAIMAADAALAEGLTGPELIAAALDRARGWPGVRQARDVLSLASPLAESPLESLTRLVLHDDGFPPPELQVRIPGTPYRVDMFWPEKRLILEIDGLGKVSEAERRREKRRELRLRNLGYRVERVGWDDVVLRWPVTRVWLRTALGLAA